MNDELPSLLASRLKSPLPGWRAQARFQPELSFGRHRGPAPSSARPAAVLVLFYPRHDAWHLPLTVRPAHMLDHAGQVSLPGGVIEPGESSAVAAVREYCEELGGSPQGVELIGRLSDLYLFASDFNVIPWVAVTRAQPVWNPSKVEVDRVLEIPLAHFRDPANIAALDRNQRGIEFRVPCYRWEGERIWGATSMILAELVAILDELSV